MANTRGRVPVSRTGTTVAETPETQPATGLPPAASLIPPPLPPVGIAVPGVPVPGPVALAILAAAYRRRQVQLAQSTASGIESLWRAHINPQMAANSWHNLRPLIAGLVDNHYEAAAAEATRYYQNARVMADLGHFPVTMPRLDPDYLDRVLESQAMGTFFHQVKEVDSDQASEIASRALQGAGARLAMRGGRDTIMETAAKDPKAQGWERVIHEGACGFCAMLAGRGGVYKKATVEFRAHDHCHCTAQPVFKGHKAQGEELGRAWQQVTAGKHGAAARQAWNQYWEQGNEQGNGENPPEIEGTDAKTARAIQAGSPNRS